MNIEPLEARIAPATLTSQVLTYTDTDGDKVAITISKGTLAAGMFTFDTGSVDGNNSVRQQLRLIDVSAAAGIDGADIKMTVTKAGDGDGRAHVGRINCFLHDLGSVTLKGDLGGINCGDNDAATGAALKLLSVRSIGAVGTITQIGGSTLISNVRGSLGALKVSGDFQDATFSVTNANDATDGKIGSVTIGGSLIGRGDFDGRLFAGGDIVSVKIGRDVFGEFGEESGVISCGGNLGPVSIGGDVLGGAGLKSGRIFCTGTMGAVKIGGSVVGGAGSFSGEIASNTATSDVRIGGDLIGGAGISSGRITSPSTLGDVAIRGSVVGGAGDQSGRITSTGAMGDVSIGGDLIGGAALGSGQVFSVGGAVGDVKIGRSVVGGLGTESGRIFSFGAMGDVRIGVDLVGSGGFGAGSVVSRSAMGDVRIGGDVIGGATFESGLINSDGDMGHVRIGGDLVGGSQSGSENLEDSGEILSSGRILSVTIGGSLIAGSDATTGTFARSGAVVAGDDIGPVKIGGSIVGNSTNPVLIIASGQKVKPGTGFDTAIASLTVGGGVRFAKILAGFDISQVPTNADASIGAVKVGRDWVASSLVAGASNLGADDAAGGTGANADNVNFGDSHDVLQSGGSGALIARIASITIKGDVRGTFPIGDHFGFVAQQIDKLKIGARTFTLAPGPGSAADNFLLPFTPDVRLHEV